MEIGYSFTASLEDCKNHLLKVGGREISAQDVVKPEIFVQALKEGVPSFNWNDGCLALDHQEFLIKDRPGCHPGRYLRAVGRVCDACAVPDVQPDGATADSQCFLQAGSNI
ncbi:hypothetical protein quinque_008773 [Culex quinquefasciatus]|uniref:Uncharacterized protein n=1 Tax=Culex pipiens pipiens TaxID=38569 RepID=A0ABD1CEX3_CULPP